MNSTNVYNNEVFKEWECKWGGESRPRGAMDKFTTSQPRQNTLHSK